MMMVVNNLNNKQLVRRHGMTLIEVLIGTALFGLIALAIYFSFANILDITTQTKLISSATAAIESQIEIIRNMQYQDVGIVGGWPAGKLLSSQTTTYDGTPFVLSTIVRNIDDPFDGILGGAPNDTAPADYRLVEIQASCPACGHFNPIRLTARVAPKGLETASNNGALFVNVFDAGGAPISGVNVTVTNNSTTPTIIINDTTNVAGVLQLVDTPTSTSNYQISVSKSGYSSDQTYRIGLPANPNPVHPHATVAVGAVSQVSFGLDRLSSVTLFTRDAYCASVPNVAFTQVGSKLIGTSPDVLKFSTATTTGAAGTKVMSDVEWDTYTFANSDGANHIAGYSPPLFTLTVNPSSSYSMRWLVAPKNLSELLVTITDANGMLVTDATTTLTKAGFSSTLFTGRKPIDQIDWSGSGASGYSSQSGGLDASVSNQLTLLLNASGTYTTGMQEWLVSNTFDLGTSSASVARISWTPTSQPGGAGGEALLLQVAGNTDDATWNFVGPDGTGATYFGESDVPVVNISNVRYIRYKVLLQTADESVTPSLTSVRLWFGSGCIPPGQAYYDGLSTDSYTLTVLKAGYQTTSTAVSIVGGWQEQRMTLLP